MSIWTVVYLLQDLYLSYINLMCLFAWATYMKDSRLVRYEAPFEKHSISKSILDTPTCYS